MGLAASPVPAALPGVGQRARGPVRLPLEDAELVEIVKWFEGKVPHTSAKLTAEGEEAVHRYWERLDGLRRDVRRWRPQP